VRTWLRVVRDAEVEGGSVFGWGRLGVEGIETRRWDARIKWAPQRKRMVEMRILCWCL
jgi:hypothetical protein